MNIKQYQEAKAKGAYKGNPKSKLPTKRELVGYVPMERRITALMAAGLRTAAFRDSEYYDTIKGEDDLPVSPLPRHMPADLAEVSDLAREYSARKREIEAKMLMAREKRQAMAQTPLNTSANPQERAPEGG